MPAFVWSYRKALKYIGFIKVRKFVPERLKES